jgi:hypothetical protein
MAWLDRATDRSARRWLSTVGTQLASGWVALAEELLPRQTFEIHIEAAVNVVRCENEIRRQDFAAPTPAPSALVLVAGHAYNVQTGALRNGWRPPSQLWEWTPAEWTGIRLLACYVLAARQPRGPRMPMISENLLLPDLISSP